MSNTGERRDPFYEPGGEWPGVDAWFMDGLSGITDFNNLVKGGMPETDAAREYTERVRARSIINGGRVQLIVTCSVEPLTSEAVLEGQARATPRRARESNLETIISGL